MSSKTHNVPGSGLASIKLKAYTTLSTAPFFEEI